MDGAEKIDRRVAIADRPQRRPTGRRFSPAVGLAGGGAGLVAAGGKQDGGKERGRREDTLGHGLLVEEPRLTGNGRGFVALLQYPLVALAGLVPGQPGPEVYGARGLGHAAGGE